MGISVTDSVNLSNETMANLVIEAAHLKQRLYKLVGFVVLWAISMLDYRKEDSGDCDLRPHTVPDSKTVSKPRKRKAGGDGEQRHASAGCNRSPGLIWPCTSSARCSC